MTTDRLKNKKYLIVARASSDSQEASNPDQIKICRMRGDDRGGECAGYIELDGVPGSNFRNIDHLVDDLIARKRKQNDFDFIVVQDASRLARSGGDHAGKVIHELRQAGIGVVFASGGVEGPYASVINQFQFEMAREQVRRSSHAIARGQTSALLAGRRLYCNRRPFGTALGIVNAAGECMAIYRDLPDGTQARLDPETGEIMERFDQGHRYRKQKFETPILLPDDSSARETVGMIYRLHLLDDLGTSRIARMLNEQGRYQHCCEGGRHAYEIRINSEPAPAMKSAADLVDEWAQVDQDRKAAAKALADIKERIDNLKLALTTIADAENLSVICGTTAEARITRTDRLIPPRKTHEPEAVAELEAALRASPWWANISCVDRFKLQAALNGESGVPPDLLAAIRESALRELGTNVRLKFSRPSQRCR